MCEVILHDVIETRKRNGSFLKFYYWRKGNFVAEAKTRRKYLRVVKRLERAVTLLKDKDS